MNHTASGQVTNGSFTHSAGGPNPSSLPHPACTDQRQPYRKSWTGFILLTTALSVFAWAPPVAAQQEPAPTPNTEDTSSIPHLSDFTPPYTCPWFIGRPASCNTPIKVSLECVDLRTIPEKQLKRPLTSTEISNNDIACDLLPQWIDQDPRIEIAPHDKASLHLKYRISPVGLKFTGLVVYVNNANIQISKGISQNISDKYDELYYFVEKSLVEIEKEGYLP